MISLIIAMDENRVIGKDNQLPWHLPADLQHFKKLTTGHPIVMGRKTRDSIGRNLPNRENIIITRNKEYYCEGCTILYSVEEFKKWSSTKDEEIFIIGGAELFKETLTLMDRLYITLIHSEFDGDTYLPEIDMNNWSLMSEEKGIKDDKNKFDFTFYVYERK